MSNHDVINFKDKNINKNDDKNDGINGIGMEIRSKHTYYKEKYDFLYAPEYADEYELELNPACTIMEGFENKFLDISKIEDKFKYKN